MATQYTPIVAQLYRLYAWRIQKEDTPTAARDYVASQYPQATAEQLSQMKEVYQKGKMIGERIAGLGINDPLSKARGNYQPGTAQGLFDTVGVRVVVERIEPDGTEKLNVIYVDAKWSETYEDLYDRIEQIIQDWYGQSGNVDFVDWNIAGPSWFPAQYP